ncbi:MAG: 4-alpha-glucanotransferase [Fibrobacterota bacterium]
MKRMSGIFLHLTSLPAEFGIGDMGPAAYAWIDRLSAYGQSLWQICPIGPVGYGYSPYMTLSAFAGNSMLISPELLVNWGYLEAADIEKERCTPAEKINFAAAEKRKNRLLKQAYKNFSSPEEYTDFCRDESFWLEDYVLFLSLAQKFGTYDWSTWPRKYKLRDETALDAWRDEHAEELSYYRFQQFIFQSQWFDMKRYANDRGVALFGDAPYYVAYASSDVWANRRLFELDEEGNPSRVGGVPPDYFSDDGQLWGNPLYDWKRLTQENYHWWIERIKRLHFYTDYIRIDHFRAFQAYWAVPAESKTARNGEWVLCPGDDFFASVKTQLGELPLIAEDLGTITQEVIDLRMKYDIPGMKVFQFAFDGNPENWYLPYNCGQNSLMYSGTHDNDTMMGWLDTLDEPTKERVLAYLDCSPRELPRKIIREVSASVSRIAIFPLQDILRLGSEHRFNTPGTVKNNWTFCYTPEMIRESCFEELAEMTKRYGRI